MVSLIKSKNESLKNVPEGSLRICERNGNPQFYIRKKPGDRIGKYISKANKELIRILAQKEYDQKVKSLAEKEIKAIDRYLRSCPDEPADKIYDHYSPTRQALINPVIESDQDYIQRWKSETNNLKKLIPPSTGYLTDNGEVVRSKSELIITNRLALKGVPYKYEEPLVLQGVGVVHPDLTILVVKKRKQVYWEHYGLMDNPEYCRKAISKIKAYETNGYFPGDSLFMSFETDLNPLDVALVDAIIDKFFV